MKKHLVIGLIGAGAILSGCGGSSGSGGESPKPVLPKLKKEELQQFQTAIQAEIRGFAALSAVGKSGPSNMVFTSDVNGVSEQPPQDENLNRMTELLKQGDCRPAKRESQAPNGSETLTTIGGVNCPISFALQLRAEAGQASKSARLSGRAGYEVKADDYRGLNDVDQLAIEFSGAASAGENQRTVRSHFDFQADGAIHFQSEGQLASSTAFRMDIEALKDESDATLQLEISHRLTFKTFIGEVRIMIAKNMGEKVPRVKAWMNGEEVDLGPAPIPMISADPVSNMKKPSFFEMNGLRLQIEARVLNQIAI